MTHQESLRAACDAALAGSLPAGLKAAVDAALAAGATRRAVLARVRRLTGGPRSARGGLTYLAVAAYLLGHQGRKEKKMTKQEWREQVRALAGYDPDTSCGWGGEAGASSAQLIIDDSGTPGFPALSVAQAEEMMGRKCQGVEKHGRYTRAYFGTL